LEALVELLDERLVVHAERIGPAGAAGKEESK
jgi:hypothetical protein